MKYLLDYFGGETESVYGLAGVGDLYVTYQAGRNSRMGQLLGDKYGDRGSAGAGQSGGGDLRA